MPIIPTSYPRSILKAKRKVIITLRISEFTFSRYSQVKSSVAPPNIKNNAETPRVISTASGVLEIWILFV